MRHYHHNYVIFIQILIKICEFEYKFIFYIEYIVIFYTYFNYFIIYVKLYHSLVVKSNSLSPRNILTPITPWVNVWETYCDLYI